MESLLDNGLHNHDISRGGTALYLLSRSPNKFHFALSVMILLFLYGCTFYRLHDHPKTDLAKRSDRKIVLHYRNIRIDLTKVQLTDTEVAGTVSEGKSGKTEE